MPNDAGGHKPTRPPFHRRLHKELSEMKKPIAMAHVIRDPANAKLDYLIPLDEARRRYLAGELAWDITNGTYTEKKEK